MGNSRGIFDTVVRGLAKVGLVWALAVLAVVFVVMAAQGQHDDTTDSLASAGASAAQSSSVVVTESTPRLAGIALALFVLTSGVTVLLLGALRDERELEEDEAIDEAIDEVDPRSDLSLALGLGLLA
jgi:hypothetical protein